MNVSDWIALQSAGVTCFGVIVAVVGVLVSAVALQTQLKKLNQQLTLQHFADYTRRYQEIILRFPEDINQPSFKLQGRCDHDRTMRAMRTYFDLCFEEWYLNERKFIDRRIWELWEDGMASALSKPAFQQAWDLIRKDTSYGSAFEKFIDRLRRRSAARQIAPEMIRQEGVQ